MAKVTGPLLSFDARGAIAKTQVYSSWKGRPYVRRHVVPANPQTTAQSETRNTWKWLNNVWRYMPTDAVEAWTALATSEQLTNRNVFFKQNVPGLIGQADLTNFVFSPAANGGIPAAAAVATPGSGQLSIALTAPTLPAGWTIVEGVAACIRSQDPQTGLLYVVTAGTDTTSPYTVVLSGLTSSQLYKWGAWFKYTTAAAKTAYGLALAGTATPS